MDGEITIQKSINEVTSQVHQPALQHNGKSQTELPDEGVEEGRPELSLLPGQAGSYSKEASKRKKAHKTAAKLKQSKLGARREQWLSQVNGGGKSEDKNGVAPGAAGGTKSGEDGIFVEGGDCTEGIVTKNADNGNGSRMGNGHQIGGTETAGRASVGKGNGKEVVEVEEREKGEGEDKAMRCQCEQGCEGSRLSEGWGEERRQNGGECPLNLSTKLLNGTGLQHLIGHGKEKEKREGGGKKDGGKKGGGVGKTDKDSQKWSGRDNGKGGESQVVVGVGMEVGVGQGARNWYSDNTSNGSREKLSGGEEKVLDSWEEGVEEVPNSNWGGQLGMGEEHERNGDGVGKGKKGRHEKGGKKEKHKGSGKVSAAAEVAEEERRSNGRSDSFQVPNSNGASKRGKKEGGITNGNGYSNGHGNGGLGFGSSSSGESERGVEEGEEVEEEEEDWEAAADALTFDIKKKVEREETKHAESDGGGGDGVWKNGLTAHPPRLGVGVVGGHELGLGTLRPEYKNKVAGGGGGIPRTRSSSGKAWRPDDHARPPTLPLPASLRDDGGGGEGSIGLVAGAAGVDSWQIGTGSSMNGMAGLVPMLVKTPPPMCPICTEELDMTDSSFLPCNCGFRICLFCHHRIAQESNKCPGCRKEYSAEIAAKLSRPPKIRL